ncbi:fatty-acid amide hydrolase 2 [Rhodnius prolixus]
MATGSKSRRTKRKESQNCKALAKKILLIFYFTIRELFDWIIDFIFGFIYGDEKKLAKLPNIKHRFLKYSACTLAEQIRNRELKSEDVVQAYIERINEVNPTLNAVVDFRFEDAIKEAKDVDAFLQETNLTKEELKAQKPFLGVPFTSKESTSAKGMAFTCGLVSRKGVRATEDAVVVERVKESGAILLGTTNVPELNLWCETRCNVYGQTSNPYNYTRTTGGSSGGEASIISACGSPLGIGTDIGASIRMPANFCGLFGHKPTTGLITTKGLTFRTGTEGDTMVTAGPITRYAEDITPILRTLLGENQQKLKLGEKVNLEEVRFFYVLDPGDIRVSPVAKEIIETMLKVVDHLGTKSKSHIEKINLPGFQHSVALWRHAMSKEPTNFAKDLGNREKEVSLVTEIPKLLIGQCNFTLPSIMRLIDLHILPPTKASWAEKETAELREELIEMLGNDGVLLFPSSPLDASYHYASFLRVYNYGYWAIFNVLKFPVTQVPLGLSMHGLPVGIQVVSSPYNDHLCIAVAEELEKAFGGWVPPYQM